jgi:glycosyltransferase A (GT-A) superfamily protein (DUF2064 family)
MIDTLIVMAKECVPGRVKTRLSPPFTAEQAARIAAASLADTLELGRALPVRHRVLCFDGRAVPKSAHGYAVVAQSAGGLDARIAGALDAAQGMTLVIGMDTPQIEPVHVARMTEDDGEDDAWFGPATDGGFWALGLRSPRGDLVRGVPMSRDDTGELQVRRLRDAGLRVGMLPALTDIDTAADLDGVSSRPAARTLRALLAEASFERVAG